MIITSVQFTPPFDTRNEKYIIKKERTLKIIIVKMVNQLIVGNRKL